MHNKATFGLSLFAALLLTACGSAGTKQVSQSSFGTSSLVGASSSGHHSTGASVSSSHASSQSNLGLVENPERVKQGYFLDSAVENIGYRTATLSGNTNAQGIFEYQEGETLEFYIGDLVFPGVRAQATITPLTLANTTDINHRVAVNIARLLQTLDQDGNLANGIQIGSQATALATPINFDQSTANFAADPAVTNLIANAGVPASTLVSVSDARAHLQQTLTSSVNDRVVLSANGTANTYELINQTLGGTAVESPVCDYNADSFGRRITNVFDTTLSANVFAFHLLRDVDGDRCLAHINDRQRMEIKTYDQSPEKYLAREGEIHTYRWKFKLDSGFQPSSSFTHIFQLKPKGGGDDGLPILTFTPRSGSPERFEVSFNPSNNVGNPPIRVVEEPLSLFKGEWIDAYVRIFNADEGRAEVILTRLRDGEVLVDWSDNQIDMWREGASFNRPKWGIYRSLNNPSVLRDETLWFNDFCIAKGTNTCP